MADDKLIGKPPSSGALFEKPYMEFEYKGKMYRLEDIKGGHNGAVAENAHVAMACEKSPPVWDEDRGVWVVPVENHIIDIDLSGQRDLKGNLEADSPLWGLKIKSSQNRRKPTNGLLISSGTDKTDGPVFPIDCEFRIHIEAKIPGAPTLTNSKPFRLRATGLETWPPDAGTTYENLDDIELYPKFVPFADRLMKPVVRIPKGDKTVLTEVFTFEGSRRTTLSKLDR
jgi:hypothetical protein